MLSTRPRLPGSLGLVVGLAACASSGPAAAPGGGPAAKPEAASTPAPPTPSTLAPGSQPDVVIVLVDGLRDGAGELHRGAAAFAEQALPSSAGVRAFTAAYTASIEPFVALGSLLTARYPSQVPLCSWPEELRAHKPWCATLPPGSRTIGEVLGVYGYATAFVSVVAPEEETVTRGFEAHVNAEAGPGAAGWAWAATEAEAWWAAHADHPRLLVVQVPVDLAAAHAVADKTYEGAFGLAMEGLRGNPEGDGNLARYTLPYGERPLVEATADLRSAYEAAAAEAGAGTAGLLSELPGARPRLTVLTSLHGLSLGEFSGSPHPEQLSAVGTRLLLERTVHVPLWVLGAGAGPAVDAPVELVDVGPTLFGLAGGTAPAGLAGHDLLSLVADASPTAYAEFGDMLFVRQGPHAVTFRSERHGTSSVDPELTRRLQAVGVDEPNAFVLHDVVADPLQASELGKRDAAVRAALRDTLVKLRTGPGAPPAGVSDADAAQLVELRAKGYW